MLTNISENNLIDSHLNGFNKYSYLKVDINNILQINTKKPPINIETKKNYSIKIYDSDSLSNSGNINIKKVETKNFQEIKTIGHGRSAMITLVKDIINDKKYAFKKFFNTKDLYNELAFFTQVPEHYNIVKCFGVCYIKEQQGLLLEYIPGFNFSKITQCLCRQYLENELSHINFWGTIQYLIHKILLAIQHIHDYNFAHQDIRPSNILIDKNKLCPIVIDFNLLRHNGETLSPGKEEYAPPEYFIYNGQSKITEITDSYSIGQLLYTILFSSISPDTKNIFIAGAQINDIKPCERLAMIYRLKYALQDYTKIDDKGEYKKAIKSSKILELKLEKQNKTIDNHIDKQHLVGFYPEGYESHIVKFINEMLHPDSKLRLTVKNALNHDFIKEHIIDEASAQSFIKNAYLIVTEEKQQSESLYQDYKFNF